MVPTGKPTLFSSLPMFTIIKDSNLTFNVRESAQKMLIYIESSVTSTGTTKETHRPHLETEPPEVRTRH